MAGRRHRRGNVGATNLSALQQQLQQHTPAHESSGQRRARPQKTHHIVDNSSSVSAAAEKRKAFALPLLPRDHRHTHHHHGREHYDGDSEREPQHHTHAERASHQRSSADSPASLCTAGERAAAVVASDVGHVERRLGEHIEREQHGTKSFKDEPWYKSPVGYGSRGAVVHAALKVLDSKSTGFLRCGDIVRALQSRRFGLTERDARALLAAFDATLKDDSSVNYAAFARRIQFPPSSSSPASSPRAGERDDDIFRHHSFLEKLRDHAQQLVAKSQEHLPSLHGARDAAPAATSELLTGSSCARASLALPAIEPPRHRAVAAPATWSGPVSVDNVDRLSFEFDKTRRQLRANAKARVLLAHIHRIDAFARHEQVVAEQHEALRLAAKAMHRHEHYAHALDEEQRHARMVEAQCKGLVRSDAPRALRSVSKDSMFYTEPRQS